MSIAAQDDIEKLLQNGYIFKEVTEQARQARAAIKNGNREQLFGNGVQAKLPRVDTQKKKKKKGAPQASSTLASVPLSDAVETIWFETKSMTGGSRNILDLSKKSLVESGDPKGSRFDLGDPKFMRGGVEFFGLDPTATNQSKNITINFDGVDYVGNTILFPVGDHANGTWRLQIKGVSSSEKKITDAFRDKDDSSYLVHKVITFTKVQGDYYFMTVLPESELGNFKAASRILARNGATKTARFLGLL